MQYSAVSGAHHTWQDRVEPVSKHVTSHNWLPAGVASVAIFWIALLFIAINQTLPTGPGPDVTRPQNTATHMSVSSVPINNPSLTGSGAADAPVSVSSTTPAATSMKPASAAVPTPSILDPVLGGKGADPTPSVSTVTDPVTQAVADVTDVTVPAPTAVIPTPVVVPDAEISASVDTPLTPEPITIDLSTNHEGTIDLGL